MSWVTGGYKLLQIVTGSEELPEYKVLQEAGVAKGTNSYICRWSRVQVNSCMQQALLQKGIFTEAEQKAG